MNTTIKKRLFLLAFIVIFVMPLFANKTAVRIVVPEKVKRGTDVTITLEVTHSANNFFHYTNWVYLKINGIENKRWDFTRSNRPESNNFTRTVTIKATEKLNLEAEGNCNIHGSDGITKASVTIE